MAILLYCAVCSAILTVQLPPGERDLRGVAEDHGWESTPTGWRCPEHAHQTGSTDRDK